MELGDARPGSSSQSGSAVSENRAGGVLFGGSSSSLLHFAAVLPVLQSSSYADGRVPCCCTYASLRLDLDEEEKHCGSSNEGTVLVVVVVLGEEECSLGERSSF